MQTMTKERKKEGPRLGHKGRADAKASRQLLLLCIPAIIAYILFNYIPMGAAVIIPFKNYKFSKGILGSDWCGLANFKWIIQSVALDRALRNTVLYGLLFMGLSPVTNVISALLQSVHAMILKESNRRIKRLKKNHQSCVQCMTGGLLYTVTVSCFLLSTCGRSSFWFFVMVISYRQPRNTRVTFAGSSCPGRQGSISRPSHVGRTPSRYCVAARYIHAAVPVSHETLARPNLSLSGPKIFDE